MKKKILCFILVGVLASAMLTGCTNEVSSLERPSQSESGDETQDSDKEIEEGSQKESEVTQDGSQETERHEHIYTQEVTKEPTCDECGIVTYICECGDNYTEETGKLDHCTDRSEVTKQATCEEEGIETFYCIFCGRAIYTESIAKLPHSENCKHEVAERPTDPKEYTFTQYIKIMYVTGTTGLYAWPDENSNPYQYLEIGTAVPVVSKCDQANFYRTAWGITVSGQNLTEERPIEYAPGGEEAWENFREESDATYTYWSGTYRVNGYELYCEHMNKPFVERHIGYAKQGLYTLMYRDVDTPYWSGTYEIMIEADCEFNSSEYMDWIVAYMESKGLNVSVKSEETLLVYRLPKDENTQNLKVISVSVGK